MEDDIIFRHQDEIIQFVKLILNKMKLSSNNRERQYHLNNLMVFLISSSNDIAQNGDLYEAAGRLYSAAYYLEENRPKNAREIYKASINYYNSYFHQIVIKGAVKDAANVALKIAKIYCDKLHDRNNEKNYINKAIGLIANQIIILEKIGSPRELCGRFQTLSILYSKIKDWEKVISSASSALKIAQSIEDFSVISNAFNYLILAKEKLKQFKESEEISYQCLSYFKEKSELFEVNQKFIPLSQIYQIIKNTYKNLHDFSNFKIYSIKEAGVYISLAKNGIINNISKELVASYYRGAGLCYQETNGNHIESASCFYIAGNFYIENRKYLNAYLNFEDSARNFEYLRKYKKAFDLYQKSGYYAFKVGKYRKSIVNYISAYNLVSKAEKSGNKILYVLIESFKKLTEKENQNKNYFVVASLKIETIKYIKLLPKKGSREISNILTEIYNNYKLLCNSNILNNDNEMYDYLLLLTLICSKYFNDQEMLDKIFSLLKANVKENKLKY